MDQLTKLGFTRERRLERNREELAKRLVYKSNFLKSSLIIFIDIYNLDFSIILVVIV